MIKKGVIAFEASCDDTALSWLAPDGTIVTNHTISNYSLSLDTGGIVPERQARAHSENYSLLLRDLTKNMSQTWGRFDLVAATLGPGLVGGLMLGTIFARSLAWQYGVPFYPVNHLAGHLLSPRFQTQRPHFPYLALLVSGGHSQIIYVAGVDDFILLGTTLDDALGEAFDKTATLLGFDFPGGPAIEQCALDGDPKRFALPRPLFGREEPNFSFSGLKSAVRRLCRQYAQFPATQRDDQWRADVSASFQEACLDCVCDRLQAAYSMITERAMPTPRALTIVGGVARNLQLRRRLVTLAATLDLPVSFPPLWLCTDNAAMIGWAALEQFNALDKDRHEDRWTARYDPVRATWPIARPVISP